MVDDGTLINEAIMVHVNGTCLYLCNPFKLQYRYYTVSITPGAVVRLEREPVL